MTVITASEARANLYRLIDEVATTHEPLLITGTRNKAVLIAEDDWQAIQETLFLPSVHGIGASIREGMKTPLDQCSEELNWRLGAWFTPNRPSKMPGSLPQAA